MERPIIFKDEMIRAILEGRKTQTRRVMNPQPEGGLDFTPFAPFGVVNGKGNPLICRYGAAGEHLWVRETWCEVDDTDLAGERWVDYRATPKYSVSHPAGWENAPDDPEALKWRPSIHMPRWASRITLEITDVRVERLQDISRNDARAEGVAHQMVSSAALELDDLPEDSWVGGFRWLWQSINGPDSWDANPWVWVIEFRRVH